MQSLFSTLYNYLFLFELKLFNQLDLPFTLKIKSNMIPIKQKYPSSPNLCKLVGPLDIMRREVKEREQSRKIEKEEDGLVLGKNSTFSTL